MRCNEGIADCNIVEPVSLACLSENYCVSTEVAEKMAENFICNPVPVNPMPSGQQSSLDQKKMAVSTKAVHFDPVDPTFKLVKRRNLDANALHGIGVPRKFL